MATYDLPTPKMGFTLKYVESLKPLPFRLCFRGSFIKGFATYEEAVAYLKE